MTEDVARYAWPAGRLGEAMEALGRHAGLIAGASRGLSPPGPVLAAEGEALDRWVEAAAAWLGFEAEPAETPYPEVAALVVSGGPALVRLPSAGAPSFLALLRGTRRHARLLTPELRVVRVAAAPVRAALRRGAEARLSAEVDGILETTGVRRSRRPRARSAMLAQLLAGARATSGWQLRTAGDAPVLAQAAEAGLPSQLALLVFAEAATSALWVGSWWLLGWICSADRPDPGWLLAWVLLLATSLAGRLGVTALVGAVAIRAGSILKRRLLAVSLGMDPDVARRTGVGRLYGLVMESGAIDGLGLSGGLAALAPATELVLAVGILALGSGGWPHAGLLVATIAATLGLAARYAGLRQRWTEERLEATHELVERMVGHRTRLAQEPRGLRHEDEDLALDHYARTSDRLDHIGSVLRIVVPRGWLIVGLLGLAPAFIAGEASASGLAVGLGGVLLAYQALGVVCGSIEGIAAAWVAWRLLAPLRETGAGREPPAHPDYAVPPPRPAVEGDAPPRLDARELTFAYPGPRGPVLCGASIAVRDGARILLQGRSGGGKSTLAALLAGLRAPTSGLLLWDGLDPGTLGALGWRRRVALAPQFHENHVLMGPLAFNLLMGRRWPPRREDLEEAERVCRALDLGALLDRMPAGIHQVVGETGWQLSHGERSRLYLARALLQGVDLIILDESFSALDPRTLRTALSYVMERAPALLVVAHP
jgi:ATP-binding cassette, subfamily B, bacterial